MKKPSPYKFEDIAEEIQNNCDKGIYCSYCGQWAHKYRRVLGAPIARFLIRLYKAQQKHDRYYTTRELYTRDNKASTDGVMARYWGLIEVAEAHNAGGAPVGSYTLTAMGRRFVMGIEYINSHAYVYNSELLELDGELINIHTALGKKWNYGELMEAF